MSATDGRGERTPAQHVGACSDFHAAIELIGRRWNGLVLQRLMPGALRYNELRAGIPGITDAMLSQRLKELEAAGIVQRHVTAGRPVEVRYVLTDIGARLGPILDAVGSWGVRWRAQMSEDAVSSLCQAADRPTGR